MTNQLRWWLLAVLLWVLALVLFKAQLMLEASESEQFVTRATIEDAGTNDSINVYLWIRFPDGSGIVVGADEDLALTKFLRKRIASRVRKGSTPSP